MTEIYCHGSPAVIEDILNHLAAISGFRLAEAGEFTRRALDNDKTDITSAEGLADLIDANTLAAGAGCRPNGGQLAPSVESWRSEIISCLAELETSIDFADERASNLVRNADQKSH